MRFRTLVVRAFRLRCPYCGQSKLFRGWFRMQETCATCEASFSREGGFYLGSIYFNYGLTALIVTITYPLLLFNEVVPRFWLTFGTCTFVLLFPLWFFRYARSLWLGFDEYSDPRDREDV